MRFCANCGNSLGVGHAFCAQCGAQVLGAAQRPMSFQSTSPMVEEPSAHPRTPTGAPTRRWRRNVIVGGAAATAVAVAAFAIPWRSGGVSLPSELTAARFDALVTKADMSAGPHRETMTATFSLGSQGSIEMDATWQDDNTAHEGDFSASMSVASTKFMQVHSECISRSCYVNGEVIGIPVTGETKAKWVEVPTPPPRKAPNPIVELAQAFRGVVLEVAIPPGASPQAA
jgi:hypothetical protein